MLENQNTLASEAVMSGTVRIGNYELLRYLDVVKKDDELWVVLPSRVDRLDCNGEL